MTMTEPYGAKRPLIDRRTAADEVFDVLHERITTLALLPNDKISEAEIAAEFGVSRQPVRDAFSRLGSVGFLMVRPQKATIVRPFSLSQIRDARFVRMAIETDVARRLVSLGDTLDLSVIEENLEKQHDVVARGDRAGFYTLDNAFHRALCDAAGVPGAFWTITEMKVQVDRLCKLSLTHGKEMEHLVEDHAAILAGLKARDEAATVAAVRTHLTRLDRAISEVRESHPQYFTD